MSDPEFFDIVRQIQPEELSGLPPFDEAEHLRLLRFALKLNLVLYEEVLHAAEEGKLVTALDVCQVLSGVCHGLLKDVQAYDAQA